ncbi:MAG: hypothetical protein R3Y19_03780 [Rikenellaceae bacterium]
MAKKYIANYEKQGKLHIVEIKSMSERRLFRTYSKRSANALVLLVDNHPMGITTKDMKEKYGIVDNKLFGELLDQSGFREYLYSNTRRDNLKLWELDIDNLFENTKNIADEIIWFGISSQMNLADFKSELNEKYELRCNITGLKLYENPTGRFMSNLRKVAIDHRIPQLKKGEDHIDNLQYLSYYVNERKNQVCAKCNTPECKQCALAYPEHNTTIYPTKEDISELIGHFI